MSVHRVFSSADSLRIKEAEAAFAEAKAKNPKAKPRKLTPAPKPIGWDVRWRQNGKRDAASVRFLVSQGFSHLDATEFNAKISRMKLKNNGVAYRWMVLGDRTSADGSPTLAEFALGPFMKYVTANLKPATIEYYATTLAKMILNDFRFMTEAELEKAGLPLSRKIKVLTGPSELSRMPIDKIRHPHVSDWCSTLRALHVGKRQQGIGLEVLSSVFGFAVEEEVIDRSPIKKQSRAVRGSKRKSESRVVAVAPSRVVDPVSIETIRRYLELRLALRDWTIIALLGYCDLRPNEVSVLEFRELLKGGSARTYLELQRGMSAGIEVDTPKNGEMRIVKLFDPVRDAIERYYDWCGSPPLGNVAFPTMQGTTLNPLAFNDAMHRYALKVGVDVFPAYDLRHTAASLLSTGGDRENPGKAWSSAECAKYLGHSVAVFGRVYQHVVGQSEYRQMPIEDVIKSAAAKARVAMPGTPVQDPRIKNPYWGTPAQRRDAA